MQKPYKISHSGQGKYAHCPRMFYNHYVEKVRPVGTTSSLLFGSAIDEACEVFLLERDVDKAFELFRSNWEKTFHNKDGEFDPVSIEIDYHTNDFDHELLNESDNEYLIKDTVFEDVSSLYKDGKEKERIAYANWLSLLRKGELMLTSFITWVEENVEEVLGTQTVIELEDEQGNAVTGKADFILKLYGYDKPILVDLKTAARPYKRDSVKESEQLALYFYYLKNTEFPDMERAAYLVLPKQIKKNRKKTCLKCGNVTEGREKTCAVGDKKNRCHGDFLVDIQPECVVQYIHDEIDPEFIEQNIQKFNQFVDNLNDNKFEENWEGCESYYGRPCPYYEYCRSGDMTGLCKKEEVIRDEEKESI